MVVAEGPISTNYCNNTDLMEEAGLIKSTLGQFLGYGCSEEFYHCRWQSDGFRTYRKKCKPGLVYDVLGTQNCNYDYNVKSCGVGGGEGPVQCNSTDFHCSLSEKCVPMSSRCDGHYDCAMEEDEQNCPLCTAGEFACKVSEQCIPLDRRCNGLIECDDGTDERDCDVCGHGLFHCGKSNECIPMDERCDGRRQCPHGEDEMLCKKTGLDKKFTCQSRDFEILSSQVCDGQMQCPDGSDEAYCEIPNPMGSSITFSSNPNPETDPIRPMEKLRPAPPSQPLPAPEEEAGEEAEEEEYDYDQIKDENSNNPAPFPMLSLANLPAPTTKAFPTRASPPPPPPPAPRPAAVKPAFNKPKPRINNVNEGQKQQQHRIVQPTLVKVTSQPRLQTTRTVETIPLATTPSPTRYPTATVRSRIRQPMAQAASSQTRKVTPIPLSSVPTSQTEKVFIMQVTASPTLGSSKSKAVHSPFSQPRAPESANSNLNLNLNSNTNTEMLKEITSHINGGMSQDLLAKIESMIKSEMQGTPGSTRRLHPRRPYV